ncbi:YeeE/YedE family protein [Candidatus Methylobacter oryzae]|uniref:YeeE/YedE family protein n=1 Tax=Candidatus Methylobacter oryzae TaxID=2497749 RepID=A0ABY3C7E8_9GAMM|nr:YeeE/YedE family protein [Candidatus Methylobacter oryzae]TRW91525.1 YeeE/YedE family protein [Candidatus Methylobacter oryzae]
MLNVNAFLVGLIFGLGLIVSGMTNPAKVIGFLDLAGDWDPSLAFVMGGAISIGAGAFTIAKKRQRSLLGEPMRLSNVTEIDKSLLAGSLVFGIGWGLSGFCPGPAVVSAAAGQTKAMIFVVSMLAGMVLYKVIQQQNNR